MSNVAQNGEKTFEYYLHLPILARMEIVDAMRADDRCRFTRCSKVSNKEAKASKNFIGGLSMFSCDQIVDVNVSHGDEGKNGIGYRLRVQNSVKKYMECLTMDETKFLWRKDLDSSVDIVLYAAEIFKQLLKLYQRKIHSLGVFSLDDNLKDFDFGIEKLSNLKSLSLNHNYVLAQYLTKTGRPLKQLSVLFANDNFDNLENFNQIYQVRERLYMQYLKLTNEQFIQLSASDVKIHIGHLTVENIYQFIKSWQNGTIGKNVEMYEWWELESNGFDNLKLFRLLGMKYADVQDIKLEIEIKHHNEAGRKAKLSCLQKHILTFVVTNDNDE